MHQILYYIFVIISTTNYQPPSRWLSSVAVCRSLFTQCWLTEHLLATKKRVPNCVIHINWQHVPNVIASKLNWSSSLLSLQTCSRFESYWATTNRWTPAARTARAATDPSTRGRNESSSIPVAMNAVTRACLKTKSVPFAAPQPQHRLKALTCVSARESNDKPTCVFLFQSHHSLSESYLALQTSRPQTSMTVNHHTRDLVEPPASDRSPNYCR